MKTILTGLPMYAYCSMCVFVYVGEIEVRACVVCAWVCGVCSVCVRVCVVCVSGACVYCVSVARVCGACVWRVCVTCVYYSVYLDACIARCMHECDECGCDWNCPCSIHVLSSKQENCTRIKNIFNRNGEWILLFHITVLFPICNMSVWFDSHLKSPLWESVLRLIPQNDKFKVEKLH